MPFSNLRSHHREVHGHDARPCSRTNLADPAPSRRDKAGPRWPLWLVPVAGLVSLDLVLHARDPKAVACALSVPARGHAAGVGLCRLADRPGRLRRGLSQGQAAHRAVAMAARAWRAWPWRWASGPWQSPASLSRTSRPPSSRG